MRITKAEFLKSVAGKNLENNLPEIAFVGRSNVGKSSLINALTNRKNLAKTSSTPGKTKLINYFTINDNQFYFVDLPGYGYHKAGGKFDEEWADFLENYLLHSQQLKLVFILLDIRHTPNVLDMEMIKFLSYNCIPFIIVATKCDKISRAQVNNSVLKMASNLKVGTSNIVPVSSEKKLNLEKIYDKIDYFLNVEK